MVVQYIKGKLIVNLIGISRAELRDLMGRAELEGMDRKFCAKADFFPIEDFSTYIVSFNATLQKLLEIHHIPARTQYLPLQKLYSQPQSLRRCRELVVLFLPYIHYSYPCDALSRAPQKYAWRTWRKAIFLPRRVHPPLGQTPQ